MGLNDDVDKIESLINILINDYRKYTFQEYTTIISRLLAIMTKVVNQLVDFKKISSKDKVEKSSFKLVNRALTEASFYSDIVVKLESFINNLTDSLLDSNNEWKIKSTYSSSQISNLRTRLEELSNNVYLFCELVKELFVKSKYEEEKISVIIFDLMDLGYDAQADLIQEAVDSLGNGSEYEFCGKIRSSLEQIVENVVIEKGQEKADKLYENLQILKREGVINDKLPKAILANYSFGSQFIHSEIDLSSADVIMFVDQTLNHIQFLINKVKELQSENN